MNYRKFGNTGEKISALGFGCMRFPEYEKDGKMYVDQDKVDEMVAEAYRQGVNYFDTAPKYCNCNSEEAVGRAVKGFRDKVLLSTKIPLDVCKKPGDYRRALEHSLDKLGTDHLDFYHFWGINRKEFDQTIMAQDLLADAAKAKEEGLIRHISFSFHDEPLAIKYIIDESKKRGIPMESMLVQYNLLDRTNEDDNELTGTLVHSAGDDGAYGNFWGVYAPYSVEAPLDMNPRLRHLLPPGESQWTLDLTTNQMKITQNNVSSTMIFGTEGNNRLFRFLLPSAAGEPGRDSFYDNMWRSSTELFYVMYKVGD